MYKLKLYKYTFLSLLNFIHSLQIEPSETKRKIETTSSYFEITCKHDDTKNHTLKWYKQLLNSDQEREELSSRYYSSTPDQYKNVLKSSLTVKIDNLQQKLHSADYFCEIEYTNSSDNSLEKTNMSQKIIVYDPIEVPEKEIKQCIWF